MQAKEKAKQEKMQQENEKTPRTDKTTNTPASESSIDQSSIDQETLDPAGQANRLSEEEPEAAEKQRSQEEHQRDINQALDVDLLGPDPPKTWDFKQVAWKFGVFLAVLMGFFLVVYYGAKPKKYAVQVGDIAREDIFASRDVEDKAATEKRAKEEMRLIVPKMYRSAEISTQCLNRVNLFGQIASHKREELYLTPSEREKLNRAGQEVTPARPSELATEAKATEAQSSPQEATETEKRVPIDMHRRKPTESEMVAATTALISEFAQQFEGDLDQETAKAVLTMTEDRYSDLIFNLVSSTEAIMADSLDSVKLNTAIQQEVDRLQNAQEFYKEDAQVMRKLLTALLQPNVYHNQDATETARQDAYDRAQNNPVIISKGTVIVSKDTVIDQKTYDLLSDLNLTTDRGQDWSLLLALLAYVTLIIAVGWTYLSMRFPSVLANSKQLLSLLFSLFVPLIFAAYVGKNTPLAIPAYFTTILLVSFFGFEMAIVMSFLSIVILLPLVGFSSLFFVPASVGVLVTALYSKRLSRQEGIMQLFFVSILANIIATAIYCWVQGASVHLLYTRVVTVGVATIVADIVAMGTMPLFELFNNTISPLKLISLAQPGNKLMKMLFIEAPGTSQHSMMVANLADSAAEAIGANAMLCRVGAYYHDIGKLRNPIYFTENQAGDNPHNALTPEESAKIILRHTLDGIKLAEKYNLPQAVQNIIIEHHGTTVLQYFYEKAKREAEKAGRPMPKREDYTYDGVKPSSRESGIVMLADSTEAAMKSTGIQNLEDAEDLMRKIVKIKTDQNQLTNSGLSYADVEVIIQSFLQVYAGQFHKRIKY